MIEILPMEDRKREREILEKLPVGGGEPRVLAMKDRGAVLGHVAVELDGDTLRILALEAGGYGFERKPQGEEVFVLDTLVRSAASYGEALGARRIETAFADFFGFFKARGFAVEEGRAFGPMGLIVKYG